MMSRAPCDPVSVTAPSSSHCGSGLSHDNSLTSTDSWPARCASRRSPASSLSSSLRRRASSSVLPSTKDSPGMIRIASRGRPYATVRERNSAALRNASGSDACAANTPSA